MKMVIFGATGRTGIPLVQQALEAGHEVVAFVRSPDKMPVQHERLTLVQGDATNRVDVEAAIAPDTDVVISVLAPTRGAPRDMLPTAASHILTTMKQRGLRRVIWMTGAGVSMPQDQPKLINHLIRFALKTLSGDVLAASEQAVQQVQQSGLDYVIVRAPMLTDGEGTGQYRVGWVGVNTGPRLARADAARFILAQAEQPTHTGQAPVISN